MRADAIGLFPQKVAKCRLLFFEKTRFEDFLKTGRDEIPTDGTVSEITFCPAGVQRAEPFVQGMQRGAECRWHSFSTD